MTSFAHRQLSKAGTTSVLFTFERCSRS